MNRYFNLIIVLAASLGILAGCTSEPAKHEITNRLGSAAWMLEREVPAAPFSLTVRERMHERFAPANIYIEGDNLTWLSNKTTPNTATPKNPVALHLATRDKAQNVAWLARPCQYSGTLDGSACDPSYWSHNRFAPDVLASYNTALNEMKARYNIEGFNLIGFSGGGAVAALLAAHREDVISLRTVAGNLDHTAYSDHHAIAALDGSLNPPTFAKTLRNVAQYHFIGGQDTITPPTVLHSYLQSLGDSNCAQYALIQEAEHTKGWVDKWPELLAHPVECRGPAIEEFPEFELPPEPIRIQRELPSKK